MPNHIPHSAEPGFRDIKRSLRNARDSQIEKVVAMVDIMRERGAADGLIDPLRPRLSQLRPARPLRFARLMFMPLNLLIAPAAHWRPGNATVPRTTLRPLADTVLREGGQEAHRILCDIEGSTTADAALITEAGDRLWRLAAPILLTAPQPEGWEGTGLALDVYAPLARKIGAVLRQIQALTLLTNDAALGLMPPDPAIVGSMLRAVAADEPAAQPLLVALLLARVPQVGPLVARAAASLEGPAAIMLRMAIETAEDVVLQQLDRPGMTEAQLNFGTISDASAQVRSLSALLWNLEIGGAPAPRKATLRSLRQRLDASCVSRFTQGLTDELLVPLFELPASQCQENVNRLEAAARGLRELETIARPLGGAAVYDKLLLQASDSVQQTGAAGALARIDIIRLVEILAGPDAALALLS